MIRGGRWKATNPNAPADRVSFHLNARYSPWRSWGSIAREFLEVKDSPSGLQNFTNSVLAEPWKIQVGEAIQETGLLELRADYALGTIPVKPRYITIAAKCRPFCSCRHCPPVGWGRRGLVVVFPAFPVPTHSPAPCANYGPGYYDNGSPGAHTPSSAGISCACGS